MQKGYSYTVYLYLDELSGRIAASSRLEDYLSDDPGRLKPDQAVDLLIYAKKAISVSRLLSMAGTWDSYLKTKCFAHCIMVRDYRDLSNQ